MIRNYKQEERLKEMGIKDPIQFEKYMMLENKNMSYDCGISFGFLSGMIMGMIITIVFVYVL